MGWSGERRGLKSLSVLACDDALVGGGVVGESARSAVPTQFFAWESGGLDGEEAGFSDSPTYR